MILVAWKLNYPLFYLQVLVDKYCKVGRVGKVGWVVGRVHISLQETSNVVEEVLKEGSFFWK